MAQVLDDDGKLYPIHFVGLFSRKRDAIPLMCIHGWPGKLRGGCLSKAEADL